MPRDRTVAKLKAQLAQKDSELKDLQEEFSRLKVHHQIRTDEWARLVAYNNQLGHQARVVYESWKDGSLSRQNGMLALVRILVAGGF